MWLLSWTGNWKSYSGTVHPRWRGDRAYAATEGSKTARNNQFCETNVREKLLKDDPNPADNTFCTLTDECQITNSCLSACPCALTEVNLVLRSIAGESAHESKPWLFIFNYIFRNIYLSADFLLRGEREITYFMLSIVFKHISQLNLRAYLIQISRTFYVHGEYRTVPLQ